MERFSETTHTTYLDHSAIEKETRHNSEARNRALGSFAVMSFNVNGQPSMHSNEPLKRWSIRFPVVRDVIESELPDVIGFQEFGETTKEDVFDPWDENPYSIYRGERVNDIFINSIAWNTDRFTERESFTSWLTPSGTFGKAWGGIERGYSAVLLEDQSSNQPLWLYNLHLDNQSALARLEATKLVIRDIEDRTEGLPVAITGDLNTVTWPMPEPPHEDYYEPKAPISALSDQELFIRLKAAGFIDASPIRHSENKVPQPTFHAYLGDNIHQQPDKWGTWNPDGIYVRGLGAQAFTIVTSQQGGVYPSDHYPIKATLSGTT